jgi:hypothetical protein
MAEQKNNEKFQSTQELKNCTRSGQQTADNGQRTADNGP